MFARIGVIRALNAGKPDPAIVPPRKRAKAYKVIRYPPPGVEKHGRPIRRPLDFPQTFCPGFPSLRSSPWHPRRTVGQEKNRRRESGGLHRSRNATRALNMLREYSNNVTFHGRGFIEQLGGYFLDSVAMGHELRLPRDAWRTFYLCELIHRGVADLTLHRFVVVHHRKCESQPLVVVSPYSATSQRHPKSPFQDNPRRMRRPIVSVESLGAGPTDACS
jgi:hypothetical protein